MKKIIFLIVCMLGIAVTMNAQGNSKAARAVNAIRQSGCASTFFQGNTWDITGYYESTVKCAEGPSTTGTGDVYIVVASYHCTSPICPAIADFMIGRVFFCGNDIDHTECYQ